MVFVLHGTNDALKGSKHAELVSAVASWLAAARGALGPAARLFVVVPFGGFGGAAPPQDGRSGDAHRAIHGALPQGYERCVRTGRPGVPLSILGASVRRRAAGVVLGRYQRERGGAGADPRAHLLDLGEEARRHLDGWRIVQGRHDPCEESCDGVHPSLKRHGELGKLLAARVRECVSLCRCT